MRITVTANPFDISRVKTSISFLAKLCGSALKQDTKDLQESVQFCFDSAFPDGVKCDGAEYTYEIDSALINSMSEHFLNALKCGEILSVLESLGQEGTAGAMENVEVISDFAQNFADQIRPQLEEKIGKDTVADLVENASYEDMGDKTLPPSPFGGRFGEPNVGFDDNDFRLN